MTSISNLFDRRELTGVARRRKDPTTKISVRHSGIEERVAEGWQLSRKLKTTASLVRPKPPQDILEDRFWLLCYKMGFHKLSGIEGGLIRNDDGKVSDQLDVVAQDDDVFLVAECKLVSSPKTKLNYSEILGRLHGMREPISKAIRTNQPSKLRIAPCLVVSGTLPHDLAWERAEQLGLTILTDLDLEYYEALVTHLGPAARFQFMADLLPGKDIDGLKITVPAVKSLLADSIQYTFTMNPSDLLKIAFVSHRMRGKGSDVNAYQRMVKRPRLDAIRKYISEGGIFPTNIVVNLTDKPRFDLAVQDDTVYGSSRVGWLTIPPKYKSAWIIDGQHRLFAYSGLEYSDRDALTVVAFEQLDSSTQAKLFIDINGEQKSVNKSLLQELFAELHWNSTDPTIRAKAVISKAIPGLGGDSSDGPFYGRVLRSEGDKQTDAKCLTFTNLFSALAKPGLFVERRSGSKNLIFGPFWHEADNTKMVQRANTILNSWFHIVREYCQEWWNYGKGSGGGLAMNDSVSAHIDVIRKVFDHLKTKEGFEWLTKSDEQLAAALAPFAIAVSDYLAVLTSEERLTYRSLRGSQGQSNLSKTMQVEIRKRIPAFDPGDLDSFIESQKAETFANAKELLDYSELAIKQIVIEGLKANYPNDDDWWTEGIPEPCRIDVSTRREKNKKADGARENYLYLSDYRSIVTKNWSLFEPTLAMGSTNLKKDDRTAWMIKINDWRNVIAHPSKGKGISQEELQQMEEITEFLRRNSDDAV